MGAGRQRWWLDDQRFVDECLRWVLIASPQLHFRDFAGTATLASMRVADDPRFMPDYPRHEFKIDADETVSERPALDPN